jgi:vacuole morphology and inheritance protein 14
LFRIRIKELIEATEGSGRHDKIERILLVLGRDFVQSNQSNDRKGGLIGLAAAALGLAGEAHRWLHQLLPPILSCFTDPDVRVRYYACESLYNVAKVTRSRILAHFNQVTL